MRVIPNYLFNDVHVLQPYELEKSLFGINYNNQLLTPNEYLANTSTPFLDVLSGFFYINWVPIPLMFATYLFFKNKFLLLQFFSAFLVVNLIGFAIYYIYPAAPPWYYAQYGNEVIYNTPGSCAGLGNFDEFFGIDLFHGLYEKNSNVFAAIPSLHASYPIIVLMYGIRQKVQIGIVIFAIFLAGIWFAAIYTSHHYIIDLLAGGMCAFIGIYLFYKVILKVPKINNWLKEYSKQL
jgi:membrane-associated phospholipid phosphatase